MADAADTVTQYRHGRVPRAVRERQVLELAMELFTEHGYDAASMDALARRAGISKPVVYGLVGSKEALFTRCFDGAGRELADALAEAIAGAGDDLRDELLASARAFFSFMAAHPQAWAMLFGRGSKGLAAVRARQARFVTARLARIAAERGAPLDMRRAEATAFAISGAYEALGHWWLEHPEAEAEELAGWLVDLALPGLSALVGVSAAG